MKQIIIALLLIISVNSFSQTKDTLPPDSEPVVSVKQINEVLLEMRKAMSIDDLHLYNILLKQVQSKIDDGIIEWRKKLKKKN